LPWLRRFQYRPGLKRLTLQPLGEHRTKALPIGPRGNAYEWAAAKGIALRFIEPGQPNQNAYVERFNRTYRTEVLDAYLFRSIEQVQHITEEWLLDYNEQRPHDALGGLPPRQFLPRLTTAADSSNGLST
jgi:putative transposase